MVKRKNLRGKENFYHLDEIESILITLLNKKEVDEEAIELRDKFYELFRLEIRKHINGEESHIHI